MRPGTIARPLTTVAACSALVALGLGGVSTPVTATTCGTGAMTITVNITQPTLVEIALSGTVSNVSIDWGGPGAGPYYAPEVVSHPYSVPGEYTISISGDKLGSFGQPGGSPLSGASAITAVTNWGALGLEGLDSAFFGATNLTSVPTCLPSTVSDLSNAFNGATSFNQSIASWDTSYVTDMSGMFAGTQAFNQPLAQAAGRWNTSHVTDMSSMFAGASSFNQPVASWDTRGVTRMNSMFSGASAFDQDLAGWSVGRVNDMGGMLVGSAIAADHIDAILDIDRGWASQAVQPNVLLGSEVLRSSKASSVAGYDKLRGAPYNWRFNDFSLAMAPTGAAGSVVGNAWVGSALTASGTVDNYVASRPTWLYQWQSSATGTGGWTNIAQATKASFTVPASQVGKRLRVRVTASNGEGNVSDTVTVPSAVLGAPSAPRSLTVAFPAAKSARVTWASPSSVGSGAVSGYRVRWCPVGRACASWVNLASSARSATVTGRVKGTQYRVDVQAKNRSGFSATASKTFTQGK